LVVPYFNSAVVYASLFAFMAVGLTLTYLTTKVPNFAYGSFVTIGIYTAYTMWKINGINPYYASLVAFLLGGVSSVIMYASVLRPLAKRGSSLVAQMMATFGIDIGFIGIFGIYTDYLRERYTLNDTKQFFQLLADFNFGGVPGIVYVAPAALAFVTIALYLLLTRTKFGVAMRASVENPPLARILGINVERVYVVSWLLAGGFAGMAGSLYTLWLPGGTSSGSDLIVEVFASSIFGGLTSIFGAILGGLAIGGSEIVVGTDLTTGFGTIGAAAFGGILVLLGVYSWRRKKVRARVLGVLGIVLGAYVLAGALSGRAFDPLVPGLVDGFGAEAIAYQKAVPLLIMVATLLILPKGLISIKWRRLLRREKKT
jgi:branched-chain amino acid transport system permease protein